MSDKPRRFRGLVFRVALVAAVLLALAATAIKFHIAPYLVRVSVQRALGAVWEGTVQLEKAEFDFAGVVRLYGLELKDRNGLSWFRVGLARVSAGGWIGKHPVLRGVELVGVECDLHFTGGQCRLPFRRPPTAGPGEPDLRKLVARRVALRIMQADRPSTAVVYKDIEVSLINEQGRYRFHVARGADEVGNRCSAAGTYDPRCRTLDVQVALKHTADVAETSAILRALDWRHVAAATGELTVNGSLRGPIGCLADCEHSASITLKNLRIDAPNGPIADDIDLVLEAANGEGKIALLSVASPAGVLRVDGLPLEYALDSGKVSLQNLGGTVTFDGRERCSRFWDGLLRGAVFEGKVSFAGSLDYDRSRRSPLLGSIRFRPAGLKATLAGPLVLDELSWQSALVTPQRLELAGLSAQTAGGSVDFDLGVGNWARLDERTFRSVVKASDIDLVQLCRSLDPAGSNRMSGKMDLYLDLTGSRFGWQGLKGRGKVSIRDGDFWSMPLVADLFSQLKLVKNPGTISEARAVFTVAGAVLHIRRGAITNQLAGIECTDGTVNLRTREVDARVVGGTFLTMNPVGKAVIGDIKNKLLARRVRGKWDELMPDSYAPLPIGQIADSSVAFLASLARNGGKFGPSMVKVFERLFERLKLGRAAASDK